MTSHAPAHAPTIYAIDFGTSNSLLAAANQDTVFAPAPVDAHAEDPTILRSILYFPHAKRCFVGQEALSQYVEHGQEGRLLRSLKRHLPSRGFRGTYIDDRPVLIEDLVAVILRELRERANAHFGVDVKRAVLGRPARFSLQDDDDDFAERRLRSAAQRAGFDELHFLPEPVAAAQEFRQAFKREGEHLVVVCDFGGGTSDFTVLRISERPFHRDDVLAIGGVPLAGDALDASIMRRHVAKHFGAEVSYRVPLGNNVLTMPKHVIEQLCSPAHLSILRRPDIAEFLRNVRSWSLGETDQSKLDQLNTLVDDALGFQLFEVIEGAKKRLSREDEAPIEFLYPDIEVRDAIARQSFETAAEQPMDSILGCLDETVASAGIDPKKVDLVCCTGGTAKVPRIAREIARRFGQEHLFEFANFHAVVLGLAQHARTLA
jgi:hypothetical chaperone protein